MRLSHRNLATAILFSTTLALAAQSAAPAPKKPATAKGSSAASQDLTKIDLSTLLSRANAGDPAAEFEFGRRYFVGLGAAKGGLDPYIEQAILWFQKAVAKGNRDAQWQLGVVYENGVQETPVDQAISDGSYINIVLYTILGIVPFALGWMAKMHLTIPLLFFSLNMPGLGGTLYVLGLLVATIMCGVDAMAILWCLKYGSAPLSAPDFFCS